MAELPTGRRLGVLVAVGAAAVVLLTLVRGPLVLLAAGTVLVVVALVGIVPLLRSDGVDWGWVPNRVQEVPPEPGIAELHRTLVPDAEDTGAAERLQTLVRAVAEDRAPGGPPSSGRLAGYLDGPPRSLTLDEAEGLVAELESLRPDTSPPPPPPTSEETP